MLLRTPLTVYSTAFFASLGLSPLVACGGTTFASGQHESDDGGSGAAGQSATGGVGTGGVTSGGSAGTGGIGGAGGGVGTGGNTVLPLCKNPKPRIVNGQTTGWVECEGGSVHREQKADCPSFLPRATECVSQVKLPDGGFIGACHTDADCTDHPNGYCTTPDFGNALPACNCQYGCIRDEDCGPGKVCECGGTIGTCVTATNCTTDQDCGVASKCLSYVVTPGCGGEALACQTGFDNCVNDADCGLSTGASQQCTLVNGAHQCQPITCAIGRPFLIEREARVAGTEVRSDWSSALSPNIDGLSDDARSVLARRWTEIALMEHASIAAFARFALELLSLGAPPELVSRAQGAMADETAHARDAFALASAYAAAPVGPGRLAIDGALSARNPLEIIRTAILEGCIGETVAAVEAAETLAYASDPAVLAVLARVAEEEQRHAELAWRFVKWILEGSDPELRAAARRELQRIVRAELAAAFRRDPPASSREPSIIAHGVLPESTRTEIRRRVLAEVVLACSDALASIRPNASEDGLRA